MTSCLKCLEECEPHLNYCEACKEGAFPRLRPPLLEYRCDFCGVQCTDAISGKDYTYCEACKVLATAHGEVKPHSGICDGCKKKIDPPYKLCGRCYFRSKPLNKKMARETSF